MKLASSHYLVILISVGCEFLKTNPIAYSFEEAQHSLSIGAGMQLESITHLNALFKNC